MEERHHVKTVPGEAKAPEYVPNAEHVREGEHTQSDDINIPLVATSVAFFAVLLAVGIVTLQAWFYNRDAQEQEIKQLPQYDMATELGQVTHQQRGELMDPAGWNDRPELGGQAKGIVRIPIDRAMDLVVKKYATVQGNGSNKQG